QRVSDLYHFFYLLFYFFFFFFFSSRRRHTRFSRDWSSDVCSSDLLLLVDLDVLLLAPTFINCLGLVLNDFRRLAVAHQVDGLDRSEERRVGKECRSRWSREH